MRKRMSITPPLTKFRVNHLTSMPLSITKRKKLANSRRQIAKLKSKFQASSKIKSSKKIRGKMSTFISLTNLKTWRY